MIRASSDEECLTLAKRHHPDLILLEYRIPEQGGIEICKKLKAEDETALIPVLVLLSEDEVDHLEERTGCGDKYLLKSLSPDELIVKINKFFL